MTQNETTAIMAILATAYPQFYSKQSANQIDLAASLWAEMFADDRVEIVAAAVKSFIVTDTKGFPPSIGIIKDHVLRVIAPPQKSELEAWGEVKKALSNSNYNSAEEFDKLDSVLRRIVGSPSQLREWAAVDVETLDSVIASNFQRSYRAVSKMQREQKALPSAVSEFVGLLTGKEGEKHEVETAPKALPISVRAEVEKVKREITQMPKREIPKPLSQDEFEKKRATILEQIRMDLQGVRANSELPE